MNVPICLNMMKYTVLPVLITLCIASAKASAQVIPFVSDSVWRLMDERTGQLIPDLVFDVVKVIDEHRLLVTRRGRTGVLAGNGFWIVPPVYAEIKVLGRWYAFRDDGARWGLMDPLGKASTAAVFDRVDEGNDRYFVAQTGGEWGKWGVTDATGKWIEQPQHASLNSDNHPVAPLKITGPHHLLIENAATGECRIKDLHTQRSKMIAYGHFMVFSFCNGVLPVYHDRKVSLVGYDGKTVLPPMEGRIYIESGYAFVHNQGQTQVFTLEGKKIGTYSYAKGSGNEDYFLLEENTATLAKEFLLVDAQGEELLRSLKRIRLLGKGYYAYYDESHYVIAGKESDRHIVPGGYTVLSYDPGSSLAVLWNEKERLYYIYDIDSKRFTSVGYEYGKPWKGHLYDMSFSPFRHTFVDGKSGKEYYSIRPSFQAVSRGHQGLWLSDQLRNTYVLDKGFDDISRVRGSDTMFVVLQDHKDYRILNALSKKISAPYRSIFYSEGNFIATGENGKKGILDLSGEELVSCRFDDITPIRVGENEYYILRSSGLGLSDRSGKILLDTLYRSVEPFMNVIAYQKANYEYGFLNSRGERIAGLDHVSRFRKIGDMRWIACNLGEGKAMLNTVSGEIVMLPGDYDLQSPVKLKNIPEYFVVSRKGRYNLADAAGNPLFPQAIFVEYSVENPLIAFLKATDHVFILQPENGQLKITRVKDIRLVQSGYDNGETSAPYRYALQRESDGAYMLVDESLQPVCEQAYMDILAGPSVIVVRSEAGKYGVIGVDCEVKIPLDYDSYDAGIWQFTAFRQGTAYSLFNRENQRVFPEIGIQGVDLELARQNSDYALLQLRDGSKVLVDARQAKVLLTNVTEIVYNEALYDDKNLLIAGVSSSKGCRFGIFSPFSTRFVIPAEYEGIEPLSYSPAEKYYFLLRRNGKYNLYDPMQDRILFPSDMDKIRFDPQEDVIKAFRGKELYLAACHYDNPYVKAFKIDEKYRKARFTYDFDLYNLESSPVIAVRYKGKTGLLTLGGRWLHLPELDGYDGAVYEHKYLVVTKGKLKYILRPDGTYLSSKGFEVIEPLGESDRFALGYLEGKEYTIGVDGEVKENF